MGLAEVSQVLWREREMLELLLFKLEEEQLVLASGRTRWLPHATREVEVVLAQMREVELLRAVQVDAVGVELGLGPGPSLSALAGAAPAPWGDLLRQHRETFMTLTAEISALAESNRDLLTAGHRAAREALLGLDESVETYGPHGRSAAPARAHVVDRAL